jgi:hypothetical protein
MTRADAERVLGVQAGATPEEIKSAYRSLCSRWHPDKHEGDESAAMFFRLIREAYEELQKPLAEPKKATGVPPWFMDLLQRVAARESRPELSQLLGDVDRADALQSALKVFLKMSVKR